MVFLKERIGKLLEGISELVYPESEAVKNYKMLKSAEKFKNVTDLVTDEWQELTNDQLWGGHREYYWFETWITIPEKMDGACVVYELKTGREGDWDATNPQFSIYVNGIRKQGLDVNHREVLLTENAKAGEKFRLVLSAFTGEQNFKLIMDSSIKVLDRATEKYYYDLFVPYQVARLLPETDRAYITIITSLNESLNLLDQRKEGSPEYYESLKKAQAYITEKFYDLHCGDSKESIYCVGHTHIDVAWLWTLAVTEDKAVRSFSTVLELMRQYPEYIFMSSQPQLYQYVKKNAPDVYDEIRKRVAEGRWETEGGMFVEADCNISSGESLIRQFMHGKRFFKEEFGKDNEILWLPDVFGYSAALPQIMKKCGIRYFMTTKISWNETNKLPCDTFEWEGIDGTRILTHFSPARDYNRAATEGGFETEHFTTYNGFINPSQAKGSWARYSQKYLNDEVLMSYGYGDGGGGPTREMLENQRRLSKGIPGCPKTVMSTAKEFFETLDKNVRDHKYLPSWVGELYLEYHRGTYTSMARNKKYNRKSEYLYQNAELYSILAKELVGAAYEKDKLQGAWEVILRNQFHDILPGSSIKEVYDDSKIEYDAILTTGHELVAHSLEAVAEQIQAPKHSVVVFNPNSEKGCGIVSFMLPDAPESFVLTDGTKDYTVQKTGEAEFIFAPVNVPSKGYQTFTIKEGTVSESSIAVCAQCMENELIRVTFCENGQIISIYDKIAQRELVKKDQKANVLMTYEDKPHNYDAWDVNNYYIEKSWEVSDLESIEVVEEGAVRSTLKISRRYLDSVIDQYISLTKSSPEIIIRNEIDWKEKQIFLKSLFPFEVQTDEAVFEIQYGNVKRKTHYNTSWDAARFEVCMHKWVDIAEDDYGVSILNDCKYGCHVHNGVFGMSMLKSGIYPNPEADKEQHSFVFSIYPHSGDFRKAGTIQKAYELNNPMTAVVKKVEGGALPGSFCQVCSDVPNAVIEVVKEAEAGKEMIIRLYEAYQRRSKVHLDFAKEITAITECNMLEENAEPVSFAGNRAEFELKPFEIKTFKVVF